MATERVLVVELWGAVAFFRRFYTTASPLSFAFPPPTTLAGLLACIVGTPPGAGTRLFAPDHCFLAVGLRAPVRTLRLGVNRLKTDSPVLQTGLITDHSPTLLEVLTDVRHRLYVAPGDPDLYDRLRRRLETHAAEVIPALGKSEYPANFAFVGEYRCTPLSPGLYDLASVVPVDAILWPPDGEGLWVEEGKRYTAQRVPLHMGPGRVPLDWTMVLVETTGAPLRAHVSRAVAVGTDIIVPFSPNFVSNFR